jgi:2-dehydro-3-deoxyphosphooctonate aldolase (KDO 8-P synthase)
VPTCAADSKSADRAVFLIAGPCVIESERSCSRPRGTLQEITRELGIPFIFKASFDKANRSSSESFAGRDGARARDPRGSSAQLGVPVLTDVHEDTPLDEVARSSTSCRRPAFLCRQTNFILNVGSQGKPVNIKKGQFLSPWEMQNVVDKARSTGNAQILVCERGFSFGYNNLVSDMRSLASCARPAARSCSTPRTRCSCPGRRASVGRTARVRSRARARPRWRRACGLFMETHPEPERRCRTAPMRGRSRAWSSLLATLDARTAP